MSTEPLPVVPGVELGEAEPAPRPRHTLAWLAAFAGLCAVLGALVGVVWEGIVVLPVYTVAADGTASTTERGLAEMFGSDGWFCALGFVLCLGLGVITWRWFHPLGWPMVIVGLVGSQLAALTCWMTGAQLGPAPFTDRMATARPGDVVPVDLTLHTPVSLVVWAFAVVIPVLIRTSLGPDEQDLGRPEGPRRERARRERSRG